MVSAKWWNLAWWLRLNLGWYCLTNQQLLDDVNTVRTKAAEEFGVDATPTFFIDGKRYSGDMSIGQMSAIIDPLL